MNATLVSDDKHVTDFKCMFLTEKHSCYSFGFPIENCCCFVASEKRPIRFGDFFSKNSDSNTNWNLKCVKFVWIMKRMVRTGELPQPSTMLELCKSWY